jgi:uncharacterized protein (TIGR02271 family)
MKAAESRRQDVRLHMKPGPLHSSSRTVRASTPQTQVVPVLSERAQVTRKRVQGGGVRIAKRVTERTEQIDAPAMHERVRVTRHRVGRPVDEPPQVRQEGDTTIVPVLEEVVVVTRQLILKEEIHITRTRETTQGSGRITLRTEHATVERIDDKPKPGTDL